MNISAEATGGAICDVVTICNQRGLHARAAAKFVKIAGGYAAEVHVAKGEVRVSGRSIMGLMMLAAGRGTMLTLCAAGEDAADALAALADLVNRGFDEN